MFLLAGLRTVDLAWPVTHPEGATIAFEREQLAALLAQAEASLAAVDAAVAAREAGTYGVCAVCGGEIGAERLEARPAATTCVTCAQRAR